MVARLTAAAAWRYVWAAPATLIGLVLALPAWLAGARVRWEGGVLELDGGRAGAMLAACGAPFCAITLGHVVLAWDARTMAACRAHERVHVRQYERWGPIFLPLYLASSVWQALRGGDPYRDNRFEREARREAGA